MTSTRGLCPGSAAGDGAASGDGVATRPASAGASGGVKLAAGAAGNASSIASSEGAGERLILPAVPEGTGRDIGPWEPWLGEAAAVFVEAAALAPAVVARPGPAARRPPHGYTPGSILSWVCDCDAASCAGAAETNKDSENQTTPGSLSP